MRNLLLIAGLGIALASCSPEDGKQAAAPQVIVPAKTDAPAGVYQLDKAHALLQFRVLHLGLSRYTARFTRFDATLNLDTQNPANSQLVATVDATSLQTNYPEPEKHDFDAQIEGPEFLDAGKFPEMVYRSTRIEMTSPNTARITGDLTLHGVALPVVLEATYNHGYANIPGAPPGAHIGFSARSGLKRSAFGMTYGIPEAGSTIGVSDDVEIVIEAEFVKPGEAPAAK